jgi:hypothetical protein
MGVPSLPTDLETFASFQAHRSFIRPLHCSADNRRFAHGPKSISLHAVYTAISSKPLKVHGFARFSWRAKCVPIGI